MEDYETALMDYENVVNLGKIYAAQLSFERLAREHQASWYFENFVKRMPEWWIDAPFRSLKK
jgi:hypothetical protein